MSDGKVAGRARPLAALAAARDASLSGPGPSETGDGARRTGVRWMLGSEISFGPEEMQNEAANDNPPERESQFRAGVRR